MYPVRRLTNCNKTTTSSF